MSMDRKGDILPLNVSHFATIKMRAGPFTSAKFSPSGNHVAFASSDGKIYIFDVNDFSAPPVQLIGHISSVSDIAWSSTGRHIVSGSDDQTVRVWDVDTRREVCEPLRGHANHVSAVAICPVTHIVASGSFDESIRLWDPSSGLLIRSIAAHSEPLTGVEFSPDGTMLLSSSHDGIMRLWEVATGQHLQSYFFEGTPPVSGLCASPSFRYVLGGTMDGFVTVWDICNGQRIRMLSGHVNSSYSTSIRLFQLFESNSWPHRGRSLVAIGGEDSCVTFMDIDGDCAPVSLSVPNVLMGPAVAALDVFSVDKNYALLAVGAPHVDPTSDDTLVHVWTLSL